MPDEKKVNKVFPFISGSSADDKQVLLRQLSKDIQTNKYAKFYRSRFDEIDPTLAQYFYSIYKIILPAREFLKDSVFMTRVRNVTLESCLDKSVLAIIKRLTREAVAERRKNAGPDFSAELEKDLAALTVGFDSPKLGIADKCYNLIMVFSRFVLWDYISFLKKFDPEVSENLATPPKFAPLRCDLAINEISAFYSILPAIDPNDNWKTVFEIFKYCRGGADLIFPEVWSGLLANLNDLRQSKILDSIIRLASGNPVWEPKPAQQPDEQLSVGWLAEKTAEIRQVILGINDSQKNAQKASLVKAIFGTGDTTRLHYYNSEKGKILIQKDMDGYIYAPALNHMLAFIKDFISREMQDLSDILLVRGQWTKNADSIAMSDAYHYILEVLPDINELDESLSDEGCNGPRLKGALLRVDRDPAQYRYLNSIVKSVNEVALHIINRTVPHFVTLGRHLKMLMNDCQKKPYELIMNWKELSSLSKVPMAQRLGDDYKRVNYFIQLMLLETKNEDG